MISNSLTISYKVQTKSKQLPLNAISFALQFVNSRIDTKLRESLEANSTTIDSVSTFASGSCEPELAFSSCYLVFTNVTTAATTPSMSEALTYQMADLIRTEVETEKYDGIFQENVVTWLGPNLAASRIVWRFYGPASEMTDEQENMFEHEAISFFSSFGEFQRSNSTVDMIVFKSQALISSIFNTTAVIGSGLKSGNLRRALVDDTRSDGILEVTTLTLGESEEFGTFQDRIVGSFNNDSISFLKQIHDKRYPFFVSVHAIEARTTSTSNTLQQVRPTKSPTIGLHPPPPEYNHFRLINTTYAAIAMAFLAVVIIGTGMIIVAIMKPKQVTATPETGSKNEEHAEDSQTTGSSK